MEEKRVSLFLRIVTAVLYIIATLAVGAAVILHLNFAPAWILEAYGSEVLLACLASAVVMVLVTGVLGTYKIVRGFPSGLTLGAFIYNDIAAIAAIFVFYMYDSNNAVFPYPFAYLILAITAILAIVCMLDDWISPSAKKKEKAEDYPEPETDEDIFEPVIPSEFTGYDEIDVQDTQTVPTATVTKQAEPRVSFEPVNFGDAFKEFEDYIEEE